MAKPDICRQLFDTMISGATRITIEPQANGANGVKFMVFIRSEKPGGPAGHSVSPNLEAAIGRAMAEFESKLNPVQLDEEAESLL